MSISHILKDTADYEKPWSTLRVEGVELDNVNPLKFNNSLVTDNTASFAICLDGNDDAVKRSVGSFPIGSGNIYNTDGALDSNRFVDCNAFNLSFFNGPLIEIDTTELDINSADVALGVVPPAETDPDPLILTRNSTVGQVSSITQSSIIASNPTIYSADSSLAGNRVVTGAGNNLTFTGIGTLGATCTTLDVNTSLLQVDAPFIDLIQIPATATTDDFLLTRNTASRIVGKINKFSIKSYDYIVDAGGNGDVVNIESALSAGASNIFIRDGLYQPTTNLTLPQNCSITGESVNGVIIDFQDQSLRMTTASPSIYSAGTIELTINSAVVTGTGTAFLANVAVNNVLVYQGTVMRIESVDSNTQVTLYQAWRGPTATGVAYKMFTPNTVNLSNFTIMRGNNSAGTIDLNGTCNFSVSNLNMIRDGPLAASGGIDMSNCCAGRIDNVLISVPREGMFISNSSAISVVNCNFYNNDDQSMSLAGSTAYDITIANNHFTSSDRAIDLVSANIYSCTIVGNTFSLHTTSAIGGDNNTRARYLTISDNAFYSNNSGVSLQGTSENLVVSGNVFIGHTASPLAITGTMSGAVLSNNSIDGGTIGISCNTAFTFGTISGNTVKNCNDEGISLDNSNATDNTITGNNVSSTVDSGIRISGARNVVSANRLNACGDVGGILINAADCVVNGCISTNNTADGIVLTGNASGTVVTGCRCTGNGAYGIDISSGCTSASIVGCNTSGNTAGGIRDLGTTTNLVGNI